MTDTIKINFQKYVFNFVSVALCYCVFFHQEIPFDNNKSVYTNNQRMFSMIILYEVKTLKGLDKVIR